MLEIQGVSKTYDNGVAALSNVSLSIPVGMYGLLGPNGAGKSSLMRTLCAMQAPDAGRVLFSGQDVFQDPVAWKRSLGYLPQDFGVYKGVSAMSLLTHFAALKGIAGRRAQHEAAEHHLQQVNLWEHRERHVSNYSGGMLRRFGLAQALLGAPKLLIVDEPTAGLDPDERNRIMDVLSEQARSAVVLLSTHIIEDIKDACGKLAVIARGQVMLETAPERALAVVTGKVWQRVVDAEELPRWREQHTVLSHRLVRGKQMLRIYASNAPDAHARACEGDIEDVYFLALRRKVV